jgi:predicted GH43/DUF377 family glycosyl hydrolase
MDVGPAPLVRRHPMVLRPDPTRVIARLFVPGHELVAAGVSRVQAIIDRVLSLDDDQVSDALAEVRVLFGDRHPSLDECFAEHFGLVATQAHVPAVLTEDRRDLIGAYSTQEYALEAAALFNPSVVAHPDQSGLAEGALRFVMSVRAVGEGHISSIEFRTGTVNANGVTLDEPGRLLATGEASTTLLPSQLVSAALAAYNPPDGRDAELITHLMRAHFSGTHLVDAVAAIREHLSGSEHDGFIERIQEIAAGRYRLEFNRERDLSERVIYPTAAGERQGMEDVRFTRFVEENGSVRYIGMYTAFDGSRIAPRMISTSDFLTFEVTPLGGPAARDKGMVVFPRLVEGRYLAVSRWDRENLCLATSVDSFVWTEAATLKYPHQAWDLIQRGNCGPPIETAHGWLLLTHGVGPMRRYCLGAVLLDLRDPGSVLAALDEPLLEPEGDEREGYVPNVVYSCGALTHGDELLVPYGCSDSSIRFATVDLPALLSRLLALAGG